MALNDLIYAEMPLRNYSLKRVESSAQNMYKFSVRPLDIGPMIFHALPEFFSFQSSVSTSQNRHCTAFYVNKLLYIVLSTVCVCILETLCSFVSTITLEPLEVSS